jgi:serine/threonine protein phosphatase PrpC
MATVTRYTAACGTDLGRVRQNNEDLPFIDMDLGVFVVIDGIGGHLGGEEAAATALEMIYARLKRQTGSIASRIREAITLANNEVYERGKSHMEWSGMACVLTVAVAEANRLVIGHVGDTRLYKIHRGKIRKVTHDHSPVGLREDRGEITEADAMLDPRRNEVFRDVGSQWHDTHDDDFIEVISEHFEPDSAWVMCSDGLSDLIASERIRQIVEESCGDPSAVVDTLIAGANEAGGKDNVTVVYIEGDRFAPAVRGVSPESGSTSHFEGNDGRTGSATPRILNGGASQRTGPLAAAALFESQVEGQPAQDRPAPGRHFSAGWIVTTSLLFGAAVMGLILWAC